MRWRHRAGFSGVVPPLFAALLLSACVKLGANPEPAGPTAFSRAVALLDQGSFSAADDALREVASTCESGADGKRALVLLAAMYLDPRNQQAHADSAAMLAARYLFLPDPDSSDRLVAESLYALALDLGADPELRPALLSGPGMLAPRFSHCTEGDLLVESVPALPTPVRESRAAAFHALLLKRDSLEAHMARSDGDKQALQTELDATKAELQRVQAELNRVRRLLGAPDTTRSRPNGL
jgi:hypothetical protein